MKECRNQIQDIAEIRKVEINIINCNKAIRNFNKKQYIALHFLCNYAKNNLLFVN